MKFRIFLCFLILSFSSLSQENGESPMDRCEFNTNSIEEHKIRSVLVFAELGIDGNFEEGILSGKAREYEFDSKGNVIYQVRSYNDGFYPFAEFGRGSKIEYSRYNEQNLRTFYCQENYRSISEFFSEFDSDGNLVSTENLVEASYGSHHNKRSFKWKNGKMVKSELLIPSKEEELYYNSKYDKEGRCLEVVSANYKTISAHSEVGDTLIEKHVFYRADTIMRSYIQKRLKQFPEQYIHYEQRDYKGKLISQLSLKLDSYGNFTENYSFEYEKVHDELGVSEVERTNSIKIENSYDERGLLVKQTFYRINDSTSKKELIKVYRYIYETTPLKVKFEKGELRRREIETHESYGPDY